MEAREFGAQENEDAESTLMECAMNALEEVFFVFTPEGDILEWNQRVGEVTGFADEEIEQMHPTDFVPDSEEGLIRSQIQKVLEEGQTRFASFFQTKEGGQIPYEFTGSLLQKNGTPLICGTGRDISERRIAQKEKEASEERYRHLFEDSQEGIAITTPEGEFVEVNPAVAEISGYSREELLSMNAAEFYVDPEERKAIGKKLSEEGAISGREVRLRRANGEEMICELSVTLRHGEDGEYYQTFFRDVTERKKAEEALKESEETFRKLAENAPVGIGLIKADSHLYINPTFTQITGYGYEEIKERPPEIIFHPEDRPAARQQIAERLEGKKETAHYEACIQTKSGETRLVEVQGARIDHQGEPAIIGTIQDVTERRRMQQEMLQIQEEERKRLGQDLHDSLASQLTGATLKLGLLSRQIEDEEMLGRVEEVQAIVDESASDVRRLSRGLNPAGLSEVDLRSALKSLAGSIEGARLEGTEEGASPLPVDGEDEAATHLYRIAQEAVTNARKYAEPSEIVLRLRREGGALFLEVEDDGKGFNPGQVGEEGLGLRSMRHRSELLGAELYIESAPGEGTLVRCRLPT